MIHGEGCDMSVLESIKHILEVTQEAYIAHEITELEGQKIANSIQGFEDAIEKWGYYDQRLKEEAQSESEKGVVSDHIPAIINGQSQKKETRQKSVKQVCDDGKKEQITLCKKRLTEIIQSLPASHKEKWEKVQIFFNANNFEKIEDLRQILALLNVQDPQKTHPPQGLWARVIKPRLIGFIDSATSPSSCFCFISATFSIWAYYRGDCW